MRLDSEAEELLRKRVAKGNSMLRMTWGRWLVDGERESAAADAISDILTAVFGPSGTTNYDGKIEHDELAQSEAQELLDRAMRAYQGDAEDYYPDATV